MSWQAGRAERLKGLKEAAEDLGKAHSIALVGGGTGVWLCVWSCMSVSLVCKIGVCR